MRLDGPLGTDGSPRCVTLRLVKGPYDGTVVPGAIRTGGRSKTMQRTLQTRRSMRSPAFRPRAVRRRTVIVAGG